MDREVLPKNLKKFGYSKILLYYPESALFVHLTLTFHYYLLEFWNLHILNAICLFPKVNSFPIFFVCWLNFRLPDRWPELSNLRGCLLNRYFHVRKMSLTLALRAIVNDSYFTGKYRYGINPESLPTWSFVHNDRLKFSILWRYLEFYFAAHWRFRSHLEEFNA